MDFESRIGTGIVGRVSDNAALPTFIPFKRGLDWCTGERLARCSARASVSSGSSPDSHPVVGYAGSYR
ncbi:hypothetical protein [Halobaculum magnesiiphilum]|uniref:Uncharacterized protein n=1 Tax=Halobaculum magnesiiphilum TaxID=1017351 RepID=A0A8T8WFG7_9EURY|nr:hypothetical protein [Halobaculum magnesiiphilum]QZP38599.1 hypothetical protein K6T50_05515 [Halobaculum magnesiiphilum]